VVKRLSPASRAYLASGRRRIALNRLLKADSRPRPLYARVAGGRFTVLVHRSTRKPGWWQATFFDEDLEPYGDTESADWASLLEHIHGDGVDWRTARVATADMVPNASHYSSVAELAEAAERATLDDFFSHYPQSAGGELDSEGDDAYPGSNVVWLGDPGRMVRVKADEIRHIDGNIFYPDKLAAVVAGVRDMDDPVVFVAPYGTASRVSLEDVKESQSYWEDEGLDEPLTTGDEDLDAFLADPEQWLDDQGLDPDDEDYESTKQEMVEALRAAEVGSRGDLGSWVFTIRDGNHRAFGALIAGEPYIWMILADNDYQDLMGKVRQAEEGLRELSEEDKELLDRLE
jgi:hypothetical protein